MAILSRQRQFLANVIDPGRDKRILNPIYQAFLGTIGQTPTAYDNDSPTYIEQGFLYNPIVYSIVKQRSDKARAVPYYIKRVKDESARKELKMLDHATRGNDHPSQVVKRALLHKKAFDEDYIDFPLDKPNELQSWGEIVALYETFMANCGECYLYMLRGEFITEPLQMYVLPAHLMSIILKPQAHLLGIESPISHYMLRSGNQYAEFDAEDVIHIKLPNPEYGQNGEHLYGLSPLRATLRNLQSSNLGIDGNVRMMLNSGVFGFLQSADPKVALTDTQGKEIRTRLQEMDASSERLGKIAALSIPIDFKRFSMGADELKPFDYQAFDRDWIASALGWDTILLNNSDRAKYDNYQLAQKAVVIRTTKPSLDMLSEALNDKFLSEFKNMAGAELLFDFTQLPEMQIDIKEMVDWLTPLVDRGVVNRDEVRGAVNFPKLGSEEMEAFTVQNDVIPLSEALDEQFSLNVV